MNHERHRPGGFLPLQCCLLCVKQTFCSHEGSAIWCPLATQQALPKRQIAYFFPPITCAGVGPVTPAGRGRSTLPPCQLTYGSADALWLSRGHPSHRAWRPAVVPQPFQYTRGDARSNNATFFLRLDPPPPSTSTSLCCNFPVSG